MAIWNARSVFLLGFAALCLIASTALHAAGFYLSEVGTPASLGTAGVANPTHTTGADTSWANPAAMTYLEDEQWIGGFMLILPSVKFDPESAETAGLIPGIPINGDDGGNAGIVSPVPSFFYVKPLSEDLSFGFSVTGMLGGGYDYGDDFVGRYSIQKVQLLGLGLTPSIGYKVNDKLRLGAGVSLIKTLMEQEIAIRQPGPSDAKAEFEDLNDWSFQGIFSLTYELTDRALLGVVYRTEADTELDGDLKIRNSMLPIPSKGDVSIDWTNPQWLDVGLRVDLADETRLYFNTGWQEWSEFSNNYITIGDNGMTQVLDRNWDDTWYAGVAVEHRLTEKSGVSMGVNYDSSPVDDENRTLDMALDELWKFSASYFWQGDKFDYSLGATLYHFGDSAIDQTSQRVRVVGDYSENNMLFLGATMRYVF